MNTILIDFKNTSDKELKVLASKFGIKFSYLTNLRAEFSIEKVLFDLDQKKILAYKYDSLSGFIYNDDVFESLKSYKVEVPKDIILDVDNILDKISKFGINSITVEEKDFLDGYSN